jgi:hypothetical protein
MDLEADVYLSEVRITQAEVDAFRRSLADIDLDAAPSKVLVFNSSGGNDE